MATTIHDRQELESKTPISKLNHDILCHIFMLNASLDFIHVHIPSRTTRHTSQVCQRWRDILLNYPLVWAASLDLADTKVWIEVVLVRAGEVPLDLVLPSVPRALFLIDRNSLSRGRFKIHDLHRWYIESPSDDDLEFALSLLPRCRQITISVETKRQSELIAKKAALLAAPHLQGVSLRTKFPSNGVYIWKERDSEDCMGFIDPPQVKVLDLSGFWTNFSSPIFRGLTTLRVANPPKWNTLKASAWLQVLSQMPLLEDLLLNNCFTTWFPVADDTSLKNPTSSISLSRLQMLSLKGISISCHEILSQLQFPAPCTLTICYANDPSVPLPQSYPSMMSELCKKFQSFVEYRKIRGLSLELSHRQVLVTNARHELDDDKIFAALWDLDNRNSDILLELIIDLFRILSRDVDDLYYQFLGFFENPEVAMTVLEPFRQVKILHLYHEDSLRIIALLNQEARLTSNPQILPQLSQISFETVKFNKDSDSEVPVQGVVDLVQHRSEVNAAIKRILLNNCHGIKKETLVTKLRIMGVEVELMDGKRTFAIY